MPGKPPEHSEIGDKQESQQGSKSVSAKAPGDTLALAAQPIAAPAEHDVNIPAVLRLSPKLRVLKEIE